MSGVVKGGPFNYLLVMKTSFLYAAAAALALHPIAATAATQAPVAYASASLPTSGAVDAIYSNWQYAPIWFSGNAAKPAVQTLLQILNRSPVDGLAAGPQIAAQVQSALQAASGNSAAIPAAERTLSAAWVMYVQSLKQPTPGMIYAYEVLKPQGTRADQILLPTAAASSLEAHLTAVSNVNPIYAQIRQAEWARMQATGTTAPDPRVIANLDRARSIPARGKFVLVDSATQRLFMYENGVPVDSMKVIVGTNEMATPLIASVMYYVAFNPYWNAPDHLVRKAIAPNVVSQGQKYLKSRGYEVMENWTTDSPTVDPTTVDWKAVAAGKVKIRVRQKPSEENFMGDLKFPFPNPEDIFLHDTPNKSLFAKSSRDLSNGCVRLEDAKRFGRWLMGREPVAPGTDAETHVQFPSGVPIYLTYLTAQPEGGTLNFMADIYGWDPRPDAKVAAAK